jgi:hypothetical protein
VGWTHRLRRSLTFSLGLFSCNCPAKFTLQLWNFHVSVLYGNVEEVTESV